VSSSWTVVCFGETEMASVLLQTSIPKFPRKTASFATSRLASFGITRGAAVGLEERPDAIQGTLDRLLRLVRRHRHQLGGGVGDEGLEFEQLLDLSRGRTGLRHRRASYPHLDPRKITRGAGALGAAP